MTTALRLSLRLLRRDWRAGELRVLAMALIVAVASVTSVSWFSERVRQSIVLEANELLAADLVAQSPQAIDPAWEAHAEGLGLSTAQTTMFPSMVTIGDRLLLADIKAVTPAYPLRGRLRISDRLYGSEDRTVDAIPPPGEAWAESELLRELGIEPGAVLTLGHTEVRVTGVITHEPDRGGKIFNVAPRLLINADGLPATGLIQPGSRIQYHLLVAGDPPAVAAFESWIGPRLPAGAELQGLRDARPELRTVMEQAERFLGLAALVSVVLAGVGLAMAARRHAERHTDGAAVMRCLGAHQSLVVRIYALELLWLGLIASAVGCAIGYVAQIGFTSTLGDLLPHATPTAPWRPPLIGFSTGMIALLGFGLAPVLHLGRVSPAQVLRRDLGAPRPSVLLTYTAAIGAVGILMFWQAHDARLAAAVLGGMAGALVVLGIAALLLVRLLGPLRATVGASWRYGLTSVVRRTRNSVAQVVAFGLGITVLLLLSLIRGDLLDSMASSIPEGAPNHFLIDVQPDQVQPLRDMLESRGHTEAVLYPIVKGRLMAIGDRTVSPEDYPDPRIRRLVEREFHMTWASTLREDNRVIAGEWWGPDHEGPHLLSVEEGLARRLGIEIGDDLRYWIAGEEVTARVASLRSVDWISFKPNFFVVATPGFFDGYPTTYISSFHLPAAEREFLGDLVRAFPGVSVLDVDALMTRMRDVVGRVGTAVQYVFLFTLLAGIVVLYAAIESSQDERRHEAALMRALGASHRQIRVGALSEFLVLGLFAGLVAALAASLVGYVLAVPVFAIEYSFNPWVWLFGLLGGLGVTLAGLVGTRKILSRPPIEVLRAS